MQSVNPSNNGGTWATKKQLANHFQCCPRTINNLMSRRILPFRKVGKFLRFDTAECDAAMDAFKVRSFGERKPW